MANEIPYNAGEHISIATAKEPYLLPAFSFKQRMARFTLLICWSILYRFSPRPFHSWRALLLRLFGAKMGPNCHFYPTSRVRAPWNLICEDQVTAGDGAEIYNPAPIHLGSHAILSQNSYLCGAAHDFDDPAFPLLAYAMEVGAYAWVCARACVARASRLGKARCSASPQRRHAIWTHGRLRRHAGGEGERPQAYSLKREPHTENFCEESSVPVNEQVLRLVAPHTGSSDKILIGQTGTGTVNPGTAIIWTRILIRSFPQHAPIGP